MYRRLRSSCLSQKLRRLFSHLLPFIGVLGSERSAEICFYPGREVDYSRRWFVARGKRS